MARGGWNNYDTWLMGLTNFVMASTLAAIGSSWNSQIWFPPVCPQINGNNTESTITNLLENYNIHTLYLLLYKVLHPDIGFSNDPLPLSLSQLHSAPGEGPFKYGDDDHSGGGWAASYKWRNNLTDQNNGSTLGNFCGCDYMLFYNLYLLVSNKNYENYHYFDNYSCGNSWPYLAYDGTTIIGDNNHPLGEYAFDRIESRSEILNSTRFNYLQEPISEIPGHPGNAIIKAENKILLSPGFFAEKGSTLLAKIESHIFWEDGFINDDLIFKEHPQDQSMEVSFDQQEGPYISEMPDESLIIYPNPFEDNMYIQNGVVGMKYTIKDMFNRTVSKGCFQTKNLCLNLNFLPSGMYILLLEKKQKPCNYKIVKL
ncbi:MAG: T9SS type A sorting domain-containing protein [Candidatus Taylorbacteria bacterium]